LIVSHGAGDGLEVSYQKAKLSRFADNSTVLIPSTDDSSRVDSPYTIVTIPQGSLLLHAGSRKIPSGIWSEAVVLIWQGWGICNLIGFIEVQPWRRRQIWGDVDDLSTLQQ
jgi:hypothetical protein